MASVMVVCGSMYTASMVPGRSELHVSAASTSSLYWSCCCCMTSLARSREAVPATPSRRMACSPLAEPHAPRART
eukprot:scaffold47310_cov66-Phaeocystis_antarctica.AAC.4